MEYLLVAWWLLAYAVLGFLGYPIAARLFSQFHTTGVGFALPIALVVLTTIAYWIGHLTFGPVALAAGLIGLTFISALCAFDLDALRDRQLTLAEEITWDQNTVVASATVFTLAFFLVVAIRTADPAVSAAGGEKFLDYGLLRSLLRAETLPPESMWFAGESVQYYYGGHLMTVLLALLTGTSADFAYNLALAGFFAMVVVGVYDLAASIAAHRGYPARFAGLCGAVFVGLAGNLITAGWRIITSLPDQIAVAIADGWAQGVGTEPETVLAGEAGFSYWAPSRIIPGTINEFPLFAWLNGDLHAHMMGIPFLLLGIALAFSYWLTPEPDRRWRQFLLFVAVPILGGLQVIVDTWSVPTIIGVVWLALTFAPAHPLTVLPRGASAHASIEKRLPTTAIATEVGRTGGALIVAAIVGGLSFALGAPFLLTATSGQEISLLAGSDRSALSGLLIVHGAFVAAFGLYLIGRIAPSRTGVLAIAAAVGVTLIAAVISSFAILAVAGPLLLLGWIALRFDRDVGFETALLIGGAGLIGIVELVYVVEQAGPLRLNTVFKVYFQVWIVWSVAMGVVLSSFIAPREKIAQWWPSKQTRKTAGIVVVVILFAVTLPYAGYALADHFANNNAGTLHATQFTEERYPEEADAIRWLDAESERGDVLLEAPGASISPEGLAEDGSHPGIYTWRANPASTLTGVPTVAGWSHEVGYRGDEAYYARVTEVDRAFVGDPEAQQAVLDAYGVTYIWIGPTEEQRYGEISITELETVELAYETGAVRIYRVR